MLNTKLGFFYAHTYHIRDLTKMVERFKDIGGCPLFHYYSLFGVNYGRFLTKRKMAAVFVFCLKTSKTYRMKTKQSLGTHYVPAYRSTTGSKLPSFIAYFLPEECKVRTRADFYYVTAIAFICATLFFFPCIVGAIACVVKAKQQKGGNQS